MTQSLISWHRPFKLFLFQLFVGAHEILTFTEFQSAGESFRYDHYAFRIAELVIHPMYKHVEKGGGKRPDYDIALVRLNYPVFDDESKLGILNVSVPQCHLCVHLKVPSGQIGSKWE